MDHDQATDAMLSERTPLLRTHTNISAEAGKTPALDSAVAPTFPNPVPPHWRLRTSLAICLIAFIIGLGNSMQPAIRVQIYEDVACQQFYASHPQTISSPINGSSTHSPPLPDRCKATPIQTELALLKGYEFFISLFPTLLCTIPYGALSDRLGRRSLLILNLFGQMLGEWWSLAVCWWSAIFPVRAIWASGIISFLGGGGAVATSVIHVAIADYADEAERTKIFLWLKAANVLGAFLGPAMAAAIMGSGRVWGAAITAEAIEFGGLLLCFFLPETLHIRDRFRDGEGTMGDSSNGDDTRSTTVTTRTSSSSAGDPPSKPSVLQRFQDLASSFTAVASIFSRNPQALLLLLLYAPCTLSLEAFSIVGIIMIPHKFGLKYSTAALILSLRQGVEAFVMLVVIPWLSYLVTSPRFRLQWPVWTWDRRVVIVSLGFVAAGQLMQGLAPTVWLAIASLGGVGLSGTAQATSLSLLANVVAPKDVSVVYSAAHMLAVVLFYGLAPVLSTLYSKGLALGWVWEGLPFIVLGAAFGVAFVGSWFIAREPPVVEIVDED